MGGEKHKFFRHLWYCLCFFSALFINIHHVSADDFGIMRLLAQGLNGTDWSGSDPCAWKGVQCDSSRSRVTRIDLSGSSITGQLMPDLKQLSSLQTLNLRNNQITGPLPPLWNLTNLQDVFLDYNTFTSIPKDFLSGLTSLQTFTISYNLNLAPWIIPDSLRDSTQHVSFMASRAKIVGPIPDIFGSFPSLQNLTLSYNNLTGTLPPSLANSSLQNLWLNNQFPGLTGNLDVLGSMSQVIQVWVHVNQFTGPIPDLSGCKRLVDLQLRDNHLTDVVPTSLVSLPSLKYVSLQNNNLQGPVPSFRKDVSQYLLTGQQIIFVVLVILKEPYYFMLLVNWAIHLN